MREISKRPVDPPQLAEYLRSEGIAHRRLDENTFRFDVPDSVARGPKVVYPVDAVYQDEGVWSTSTPLVRIPKKDSSELSAILRAGLDARGCTTGRAGPLLDKDNKDLFMVGSEGRVASPRDVIHHVQEAADTASQIYPTILNKADEMGYRFDWTVGDSRRKR